MKSDERDVNKKTEVVPLWLRKISIFLKCSYSSKKHIHLSQSSISSDVIKFTKIWKITECDHQTP